MTDYYFSAGTKERLVDYCKEQGFLNILGPVKGQAEAPEFEDEQGNVIPATAGIGDPDKWYCCVRIDAQIVVPEDIEVVEPEIGAAICGVWA